MASQRIPVDIDLMRQQLIAARFENSNVAPTTPLEGQFYYNTVNKTFLGWNGTAWIDLGAVVASGTTIRGDITNANTNPAFPASPAVGDIWFITTNAGTVGGETVEIGDQLIFTASGWRVLQANLRAATELLAGFVRLATQAETNAGSLDTVAVTPLKLATFMANRGYTRKAVLLTDLVANTPLAFTHGLGAADRNDVSIVAWHANQQIILAVASVSANQVTVESNVALTNVKLVAIA